jgi:uncharacterized OsmC-like protein
MTISATLHNSFQKNEITANTEGNQKQVNIPGKKEGYGSSINGGELLFLSLATCFCNDVYREAAKRKMRIESVDVTVSGKFGKEGEPGSDITYHAKVVAPDHTTEEINELIKFVDTIAEIHNTLRKGVKVSLKTVAV